MRYLATVVSCSSIPLIFDETRCIGCLRCVSEIGCPALSPRDGKAVIDPALCNGCGLCGQLCPVSCIQMAQLPGKEDLK